jgi:hypothetical protein
MPDFSNTASGKARGDELTGLATHWSGHTLISKYELDQPLKNNCVYTANPLDQQMIKKYFVDQKLVTLGTLEFLLKLSGSKRENHPPIKCKILPEKIVIWKRKNKKIENYEFDQDLNFKNINLSFTVIDRPIDENLSWSFPIMVDEDLRVVEQLVGQLKSENKELFNILKIDEQPCVQK